MAQDFNLTGANNAVEFALGGNPNSASDNGTRLVKVADTDGDTLREFTLTIEARSGANFIANGNDLVASIDGVTYRIEGSTDLVTFESAVSTVSPHLGSGTLSVGYQFATFRLDASEGLVGKGFLRVVVSVP